MAILRDPQSWRDALHGLFGLFVAVPAFVVTVTLWALALGGLTYGAWGRAVQETPWLSETGDNTAPSRERRSHCREEWRVRKPPMASPTNAALSSCMRCDAPGTTTRSTSGCSSARDE